MSNEQLCLIITICVLSAIIGFLYRSILGDKMTLTEEEREKIVKSQVAAANAERQNHLSEIACRLSELNKPIPLCLECRKLQNVQFIDKKV
jgi:hypothetical protein